MVSLDSSLVKTVMLRVVGDGGDANRMLDEIAAKAEALKQEHPELTVSIDRAKAQADAVAVKALIRQELERDPVKIPVEIDTRGGIGNFLKSLAGPRGWGSLIGNVPADASAAGSFPKFLASPAGVAAIGAALFAAAPLIVTLLGGLVGGAATAGAFKLASTANTNLTALQATQTQAQQALASAQNQQLYYPSAANAAAVVTAQQALTQANQAVSLFQRQNAPALGLYNAGQNVTSALSAAFTSALTSNATRQVQTRGPGRLAGLETVTEQIPGSSFISGLEKIMATLPAFIQSIAPQLGQLFRASLPYVSGFVQVLEGFVKRVLPGLTLVLQNFSKYIPDVVHFFNGLSTVVEGVILIIGQMANTFGQFLQLVQRVVRWVGKEWDRFGHDMGNWAQVVDNIIGNVVNWFRNLPGEIMGELVKLPGQLEQLGKNMIEGLLDGLEQVPIVGPIVSMGEKIVSLFRHATGSHSPSVKAMAIGRDFTDGFRIGLTQSALGVGLTVGSTGGAAAGGLRLQITGGGTGIDQLFIQWLKQRVRLLGGGGSNSVQKALGQHA